MGGPLSVSSLREDICRVLDQILETATPVEIVHRGQILRIVPLGGRPDRLEGLQPHPEAVVGSAEDFVHVDWSREWRG